MIARTSLLLFLLLPLGVAASSCGGGGADVASSADVAPGDYPPAVEELLAMAAEKDKSVLIDFHAPW